MILQVLHSLYKRLKDDPRYEIAPYGYSLQRIAFRIVLRMDGTLFDIQDGTIQGRPRQVRVLGSTKPSGSRLNPCFLWDNSAYMLGFKPEDEDPGRTKSAFLAFRKRHLECEKSVCSPAFSAVCRFLENWRPERASEFPILKALKSGFGVFQLVGEERFVHQDAAIDVWWRRQFAESHDSGREGQCLLTGAWGPLTRLHPMTKGVAGANAQAALVGFNDDAFSSYGKEQGFNAPIGEDAAFAYGSALNALLDGPMRFKHRMLLAGDTVAFWTDRPSITEDIFACFAEGKYEISELTVNQDAGMLRKLELFLQAMKQGIEKYSEVDECPEATKFFILGLSPNQGRVAVRYFLYGTVRELLDNLRLHFRNMGIERQYGDNSKRPDPEFPPIWMLLRQTARESKDIPPIFSGPLLGAVITGARYPDALYRAVIRRLRADREIPYLKAAIIKGWLVRNQGKEIGMSLDTARVDPAYRLGRLFSALEKTQEDALGTVNASIRGRYYGAASATPRSAFPRLLRIYQHHLSGLEGGLKVSRERLIQEILGPLDGFPANLNLTDQGLFAIGYYHQRQAFFHKKDLDSKSGQSKEEES